jgi:hypothetical protein
MPRESVQTAAVGDPHTGKAGGSLKISRVFYFLAAVKTFFNSLSWPAGGDLGQAGDDSSGNGT